MKISNTVRSSWKKKKVVVNYSLITLLWRVFLSIFPIPWKSVAVGICSITIPKFFKISFCVQQKKEDHTGLDQLNRTFIFWRTIPLKPPEGLFELHLMCIWFLGVKITKLWVWLHLYFLYNILQCLSWDQCFKLTVHMKKSYPMISED